VLENSNVALMVASRDVLPLFSGKTEWTPVS